MQTDMPTPKPRKLSARHTGRVCKVCGKFDNDPHNSLKDMCKSCHGKLARINKSAKKPLKKQELAEIIAGWTQEWEGFMAQWEIGGTS